jgi:hypothetical protein
VPVPTMTNGVPAPFEPELSSREYRFLRYWSAAMVLSRQCDWRWVPGFAYHEDEEERFRDLASRIARLPLMIWLATSAAVFLLCGLISLFLIAGLALVAGWHSPASITPLGSSAAMAMALILAFAAGVPLSILWGGDLAERIASGARWSGRSIDARLLRKVRGQLQRAGATLAVLFVAAALLWLFSLD